MSLRFVLHCGVSHSSFLFFTKGTPASTDTPADLRNIHSEHSRVDAKSPTSQSQNPSRWLTSTLGSLFVLSSGTSRNLLLTSYLRFRWNAALAVASYIDSNPEVARNRCVLELGAGGGLPSLVAAQNRATKVVLTDYPETPLIDNLKFNVAENLTSDEQDRVDVQGYIWGHSVDKIIQTLPTAANVKNPGFHLIILSDLIFNHSQHDALLKTCDASLTSWSQVDRTSFEPCVLVFYSHHRPRLADRDLEFFFKAQTAGWVCEKIVTRKYPPMFPEDPGEEEVRATVHGWKMTRGVGNFPN